MEAIGLATGLTNLVRLHRRHRAIPVAALVVLLVGGMLDLGLAVSVPLFWSYIVDALIGGDTRTFRVWVFALGTVMIVRPAVVWGLGVIAARTSESIGARFREAAAEMILRQPFKAQETLNVGDMLSRSINDTNAIKAAIPTVLLQAVFDGLTIVVAFALLFRMHEVLALALLATLPLTLIYRKVTSNTVQQTSAQLREAIAAATEVFQSWFQRAPIVTLYRLDDVAVGRCRTASAGMRAAGVTAAVLIAGIESFNALLVNVPALLVFMLGGMFTMRGELTVGQLVSFLALSGFFHPPLQRLLATMLTGLPGLFPIIVRIEAVLDLEVAQRPAETAGASVTGIELQDVLLEHRSNDAATFTLKVPEFRASLGEIIGISGANGSGKTTLCKLMIGLYQPDAGCIRMLSDAGPQPAGVGTALVPQRPICLDGTFGENITLFASQPDEARVADVITRAGLSLLVSSLPQGAATRLSPSVQLSGGELQRLGLARAIYDGAPIVILDEAAAGLDEQMARELPEILRAMTASHLFILVSHSQALLGACDRVYQMDASGRRSTLTAIGTPSAALLEA